MARATLVLTTGLLLGLTAEAGAQPTIVLWQHRTDRPAEAVRTFYNETFCLVAAKELATEQAERIRVALRKQPGGQDVQVVVSWVPGGHRVELKGLGESAVVLALRCWPVGVNP